MFDLVIKADLDRSLNKEQWKQIDRFRRLSRRLAQQAFDNFDWQSYCKDLLLYGTAMHKIIDGKMIHIPTEAPLAQKEESQKP